MIGLGWGFLTFNKLSVSFSLSLSWKLITDPLRTLIDTAFKNRMNWTHETAHPNLSALPQMVLWDFDVNMNISYITWPRSLLACHVKNKRCKISLFSAEKKMCFVKAKTVGGELLINQNLQGTLTSQYRSIYSYYTHPGFNTAGTLSLTFCLWTVS